MPPPPHTLIPLRRGCLQSLFFTDDAGMCVPVVLDAVCARVHRFGGDEEERRAARSAPLREEARTRRMNMERGRRRGYQISDTSGSGLSCVLGAHVCGDEKRWTSVKHVEKLPMVGIELYCGWQSNKGDMGLSSGGAGVGGGAQRRVEGPPERVPSTHMKAVGPRIQRRKKGDDEHKGAMRVATGSSTGPCFTHVGVSDDDPGR